MCVGVCVIFTGYNIGFLEIPMGFREFFGILYSNRLSESLIQNSKILRCTRKSTPFKLKLHVTLVVG